ncbi:adenylate cyclase [Sinorhizobium fredii USDA 205]|uniref:Tetratricopeptide repeat protein n=1 Tax=Rhizobium fredii TaxID=380 RepID=A0A844A9Q4_RHIFR|nr:tetratricopeptide repeat protein [Sinorhizobium fredii]KSV80830.1 adenylate cyclase [Sinorhizobium fredii USDA 205]MQX09061.1 tetratricopeptide repeat protein [Sinorhizobium fredii]GEC34912.1 guanylyl cyclase [Sinorhizobium fredii]GLS07412.1 guanylyl cyclase [Sinorhizobium fredii]
MQRKLAAILAADVVGYSRLMEIDEADTVVRLGSTRENLIDPKISAHNGRVVKLIGDGELIEFPSVVDAVRCAVEIQQAMAECNEELPADKRLEFRIGVNLGDVIVEGQDIYGDGVNVAARLEELADPGGVLISGTAFDHVERKLDYGFDFVGERQVKNIEKPVRLYRIRLGNHDRTTAANARARRHRPRLWIPAAAAALALAAGSVVFWNGFRAPPRELASRTRMEFPLPDRPSIAVLPFTNLSGEAGQQHFADGMTDSLITDLSKSADLFVVARNSTFAYQGKTVAVSQVAEELGVRYVLEGSVQRAGDRLRVNAQLVDALTGGHVWADRFDGNVADVFGVQDAFVTKIVEALKVNLTGNERMEIARGRTDSLRAKEAFDEGWGLYLRFNAKDNAAAVAPLKRAIQLDPDYGRAYAALALVYFRIEDYAWHEEVLFRDDDYVWNQQYGAPPKVAMYRALEHLENATRYPTALGYTAQALAHLRFGRADDARREAGRAIELDPNDPEAQIVMAWALTTSGKPSEAMSFVEKALRLNPNFPSHYVLAHGVALFAANDLEQAEEVFDQGAKMNPNATALMPPFASVLAGLGRRDEARRKLLNWRPETNQAALEDLARDYKFPIRWAPEHKAVRERLLDGVRAAALPLDMTVSSLTAELKLGDPASRRIAAKRLGWFGPAAAEAVPALVMLLEDVEVREEAVQSLRKIGPGAKAAVPALVAMEHESFIGSHAKDALKEIRGY